MVGSVKVMSGKVRVTSGEVGKGCMREGEIENIRSKKILKRVRSQEK